MFLSLLLPALALCVPTKRAVCSYNAPGAGTFTHHATYSFDGDTLPAGLRPNTDTVGGTPFTRTYDPSLVSVSGGYLNLKVPGGQNTSPIRGAGVNTVTGDILYASVRTEAIFSSVPGTVQSKSPCLHSTASSISPSQSGNTPIFHPKPLWLTSFIYHRLLLLQIRHRRNRPRVPLRPDLPLQPHQHPLPPLHQPRPHLPRHNRRRHQSRQRHPPRIPHRLATRRHQIFY